MAILLENLIKSNQTTIEKIKERKQVVGDPMEQRKLEMDLDALEEDTTELINQLKKML